jgi:hypothetical protein
MLLPKLFQATSKWWKQAFAAVLITFAWLFLWLYPWQAELHHIYWLQLGAGLAIFILPGVCLYGLLSDRSSLKINLLPFGFVISHLIFGLLGTAGRLMHLSFETISLLMMVLGLILLLACLLPLVNRGINFQVDRERFAYFLYLIPVLLISFLTGLIVIQRILSDDDLTYLAYLTNWQNSTRLDFNNPVFGEPQLVSIRFWLMSVPFAQALLADLSKMPGILILGGYYEPFLVILSVLCLYELAVALKLSPKAACASVLLQLSFLLLLSEYLHPGAPYFTQLSADKATAAYVLAPVFFQSLIKQLENPSRNNLLLFLLAGLSLSLMHSIILAYSVFIGGMYILLKNNGQSYRHNLIAMAILIFILTPQLIIRFANEPGTDPVSFDPEVVLNRHDTDNLVTRWGDTRYYGFNASILTMKIPYEESIPMPGSILEWGWLLMPVFAVLFSLRQLDKSIARFILACFALCFLAWFPLTGWVLGYFLNARMLARSVWLFPYGLSAVYVVLSIREYIETRKTAEGRSWITILSRWSLSALTVIVLGLFLLYMRQNNLPDIGRFNSKVQRYQGLAIAGQALDQKINGKARVIGSPSLNDLIPGLSSKSKLITFRTANPSNMYLITPVERKERISDTQRLFSRSAPAEEKMDILEKYDIQFLFLQSFDLRLFEELMTRYPERTEVIEVGGVILLQIDG